MMRSLLIAITVLIMVLTVTSSGFAEKGGSDKSKVIQASMKVSGRGVYDYFVFGMNSSATDGFDNAYDTISPTGTMNETYISTYFSHPEWGSVKSEFMGDIRSWSSPQEWMLSLDTNLGAGTPLTMTYLEEKSSIKGYVITIEDVSTGNVVNIKELPYTFTVSANSATRFFRITASEPGTPKGKGK